MPNRTEIQVAAVATLAALIVLVLAAVLVTETWRHDDAVDHYRPYIDSPQLAEFGIFSITAAAVGDAAGEPVERSPELAAIYDLFIAKAVLAATSSTAYPRQSATRVPASTDLQVAR